LREPASCLADWLAGKSASDEFDFLDFFKVHLSNVFISCSIGPVPCQDALAVVVVLDLPFTVPAGALEAEVETAEA
jgi:hypothetical protein